MLNRNNGNNNFLFNWEYPNQSIVAVLHSHSEKINLFLELNDDFIIQVKWEIYDEKKEEYTFKRFAGNKFAKCQFINFVKDRINFKYEPTNNYTASNEYLMIDEIYGMIDLKLI